MRTVVGVGVVLAVVSGCNASALTKRELVVHFSANATTAQQLAARSACQTATPQATPEPLPTGNDVANQVSAVRFRIDHADDKQLAQLESCLGRQPGVVGFDIPDLTN